MFNLDKFLNKFKGLKPPNDEIKINIIKIIKDDLNINLERKDISVRNKTIYINTKPIIKNEIFINKYKLIETLRDKLGNTMVKDIR